jgi:predicted HTH domain antitoxin
MQISIPDEILAAARLSESDVRLELACALFDADRLDAGEASVLAGLDRDVFDAELVRRGIAIHRYTEAAWRQDLETLEAWRREDEIRRRREGHAA